MSTGERTQTMTTTTTVLAALNDYTGCDVWGDVILGLGYDEAATDKACEILEHSPNYADVAVIDGICYRHRQDLGEWKIVDLDAL